MDLLDHADRALAEPEKGHIEAMMGVSENGDTPKWPSNSRENDEKPWDLMDFGGFP
jgi:hypothetical protein